MSVVASDDRGGPLQQGGGEGGQASDGGAGGKFDEVQWRAAVGVLESQVYDDADQETEEEVSFHEI